MSLPAVTITDLSSAGRALATTTPTPAATKPARARRSTVRRPVRAGYDAARLGGDNATHFAGADSLGPVAANDPGVRRIIRDRMRHEVANNPTLAGVCSTVAYDTIGPGPRLQLGSADSEWNKTTEREWRKWSRRVSGCGLAQVLILSRQTEIHTGELLLRFIRSKRMLHGLDIEVIEADRLTKPMQLDPLDGVILGEDGYPEAYHLLKEHPGDAMFLGKSLIDAEIVPAAQIIHVFKPLRPGQRRGIPELTPSAMLVAELRRYKWAVLTACETAASMPIALETDHMTGPMPGDDEEEDYRPESFDEIEISDRLMSVLPPGWKLSGAPPAPLSSDHVQYTRERQTESTRPLNVPANVALGDSSDYSYASGRLDTQMYDRACAIERIRYETTILEPIFRTWLAFAMRSGAIPFPVIDTADVEPSWLWTGRPHVEPMKEAAAQEKRLQNRTTTLAREWAREGEDWMEAIDQIAAEMEYLKSKGLTVAQASPSPQKETDDDEPTDDAESQRNSGHRRGRGR